jgi:hypothetical protein
MLIDVPPYWAAGRVADNELGRQDYTRIDRVNAGPPACRRRPEAGGLPPEQASEPEG